MSMIELTEDSVTATVPVSLKKYAEFRPSVVQSSIWSKSLSYSSKTFPFPLMGLKQWISLIMG